MHAQPSTGTAALIFNLRHPLVLRLIRSARGHRIRERVIAWSRHARAPIEVFLAVDDCLEQFALLDLVEPALKCLVTVVCHLAITAQLKVVVVPVHLELALRRQSAEVKQRRGTGLQRHIVQVVIEGFPAGHGLLVTAFRGW